MNAAESKHPWAIVKLPNLEKEFHCFLQSDSGQQALGLQHLQLRDADTLETWEFARPIDFLNWIEDRIKYAPNRGGLR
jgi:hypothetical protein